ncbi:MAG: hypothetical protein QOI48_467 [Solirubrobacteraceae bacterium]|jgi:Tfp pilus assembly protein PilV|nr:hypothetical protein [Solirubrobacteraceae bacterium]
MGNTHARTRPRPSPASGIASANGYTLVEVLIASVILVVGVLGILTLLTGALRTTAANTERIAATNLVRELVEGTRALDYDDMSGTLVQARLQARGLGSGAPWTIQRRGVTYTVAATSCTYDNPADRLAASPPTGVCTPQPTGQTGDSNGDDFRRTIIRVDWPEAGGTQRSVTQTTLVVNPSGGLGPRITSFTVAQPTITANVSSAIVLWTTTAAQSLRWVVDDGASAGSSAGTTSFTTTWNIGSSGSGSEILDGSYQITGQPFDDREIAGEAKRANVVVNRRQPYAPPSLAGGHNTRVGDVVDLQWSPNSERDILGYRVKWAGADGSVGDGDDTQVCPASAEALVPTATSCTDLSPPGGATTYYIVAVDRAPDNQPRQGDSRTLSIAGASARPQAPTGLTVVTVSDQPQLSWNAPSSGGVSFYRIYRDGTRYERTAASSPTFTDDSPRSGVSVYAVTTVDSSFNESDLSAPATWSP